MPIVMAKLMTKAKNNYRQKVANRPAKILAIETSTAACSVALRCDEEICALTETGSTVHSQQVLPQIQQLLKQANWQVEELDAVAVGQGPGSFTGLRIGVGVAQGISYGVNCPMIGVSSLASLAMAAPHQGVIAAGIDARMGELYFGRYNKQGNKLELIGEEIVCAPQDLKYQDSDVLIGNAWSQYWQDFSSETMQNRNCPLPSFPGASELLVLAEQDLAAGRCTDAKVFAPVYVRNNVAKKAVAKKQ